MRSTTFKSLLVILLLPMGAFAQNQGQSTSFSLEESIDYALKNSTAIKNAEIEKDIANAQVGETTAEGLPQVNINAQLTNNYNVRRAIVDASNFDPSVPAGTEVEFAFGLQFDGDAALNITQLLFDGSYFVGLKAARTYRELSTKEHQKTTIDVIDAVTKSYYFTLVSEERQALIAANLSRYDSLLEDTNVMFENGFVEKIDVSRLKVLINNTKVALDNANEMMRSSYDLLKYHIGYPQGEPISLEGSISDIVFEYAEEPESDFDYNSRIEYSQLFTNLQLAELQRKNNQVQYLPKLNLFANIGYNTGSNLSSQLFEFGNRWLSNGNVGISMSIPVFDGLRKSFRNQQNKLQIQQIENAMDNMKETIEMDLSTSRNSLKLAISNLTAQRENMTLAQEIYDVSEIKYQEGVGSNSEVIEAATSYKESQTNYYNALYDALISQVNLEKAQGTLLSK